MGVVKFRPNTLTDQVDWRLQASLEKQKQNLIGSSIEGLVGAEKSLKRAADKPLIQERKAVKDNNTQQAILSIASSDANNLQGNLAAALSAPLADKDAITKAALSQQGKLQAIDYQNQKDSNYAITKNQSMAMDVDRFNANQKHKNFTEQIANQKLPSQIAAWNASTNNSRMQTALAPGKFQNEKLAQQLKTLEYLRKANGTDGKSLTNMAKQSKDVSAIAKNMFSGIDPANQQTAVQLLLDGYDPDTIIQAYKNGAESTFGFGGGTKGGRKSLMKLKEQTKGK